MSSQNPNFTVYYSSTGQICASLRYPAIFFVAALVIGGTCLGRDLIAMGSDRRTDRLAGLGFDTLLVGIFGFSGVLAGLSGAFLSYSRASASPTGL